MTAAEAAICFAAAVTGGALNALAGGGSLITFPVLVWLGRDPLIANATNTVSLWPGSLAAVWGLRARLVGLGPWIVWGSIPSILGGLAGAMLLLWTPQRLFAQMVPWLVGFATLIFAASGALARWARRHGHATQPIPTKPWRPAGLAFQLAVAVYGGYFGAGMGIMMLAGLALLGFGAVHAMLVLRNVWAVWINAVAASWFVTQGAVQWPDAGVLTIGQVLGSYAAARVARRLRPDAVRWIVVAVGVGMVIALALRGD